MVGARTLLRIEEGLKGQGLSVQRAQVQNAFRFRNAGTLESTETVLLPAILGKKKLVIKAAVLPGQGSETPLLLSKEFLRQLGGVIDMERDMIRFSKLGVDVVMKETQKGHYAIPLFCFVADAGNDRLRDAHECWKTEKVRSYDISSIERHDDSPCQQQGPSDTLQEPGDFQVSDGDEQLPDSGHDRGNAAVVGQCPAAYHQGAESRRSSRPGRGQQGQPGPIQQTS